MNVRIFDGDVERPAVQPSVADTLPPEAFDLDALLEQIDLSGPAQGITLLMPISPAVIRWFLRGEFHNRGMVTRLIGGTITGDRFEPVFEDRRADPDWVPVPPEELLSPRPAAAAMFTPDAMHDVRVEVEDHDDA